MEMIRKVFAATAVCIAALGCSPKQDGPAAEAAEKYTEALEFIGRIPAYDHDLGFIMFCSYGNGYRLTGNTSTSPAG